MQCVTHGVVIRAKAVGDNRFLSVLTPDMGVIDAVARGATKPRSKLASATELFCYSKMVLFRYRDNTSVDSAEVENSFFELRQDLAALALASYIAELCCELAPKEEEAADYLKLLLNTLYMLSKKQRPMWLLKPLFELRLLTMAGFMPDLTGCCGCGGFDENSAMFFLPATGELLCKSCLNERREGAPQDMTEVPAGVLAAMRHIIYSQFEKLFSFTLSAEGLMCLNSVSERYMRSQLQRGYRSLEFFYSVAEL